MEREYQLENQGSLIDKRVRVNVLLKVIKTCFHAVAVVHHIVVMIEGTIMVIDNLNNENIELRMVCRFAVGYGTNWNFVFQTVFLSLSLLYDVLEWLDKHQSYFGQKLQYYRDITFSGLVVPFTLFISIMFWSVYTIDRELVFPMVYDQIVPWWFNHCVHTNIAIVVLVETILQARRHPRNRRVELSLVAAVGIVYAIVYYSIYFITGRWLYAVFGVMTWWQVCLYQILIWGSTFIFYFLQFPINRIFHREISEEDKTPEFMDTNGDSNGAKESLPAQTWNLKFRPVKDQLESSKL